MTSTGNDAGKFTLEEVRSLPIAPGEVLLLRSERQFSDQERDRVKKYMEPLQALGVTVILLDPGIKFEGVVDVSAIRYGGHNGG